MSSPAGTVAPAASFGARVRRGEPVVGTFVKLAGLEPVDLVALCGLDFVVVDAEHSLLDDGEVVRLVRHAGASGLPVVVRLPGVDAGRINRLLEAGAAGIQLSTLRRVADARALRSAMRYPPEGARSVSLAQPVAGYGRRPIAEYLAAVAADPPLVIGQIETATTDDPLVALMGEIDAAFLGTTDLAADLGVPGRGDDPALSARIDEIAVAAAAAGVVLGGWASGPSGAAALRARGASYLVVGSDLQALRAGLTDLAAGALRAGGASGRPGHTPGGAGAVR